MSTILPESDYSLFGFEIGEGVNNLPPPHINQILDEPCDGNSGVVRDTSDTGLIAYVECNTCHDILRVEP